jgi:hypothetical protein
MRSSPGLDGRPPLDLATLDATERVVAMSGTHPYIKLLDEGADVIVGDRSSDCAIFAAPAIRRGFPEALAYFYGCGSSTTPLVQISRCGSSEWPADDFTAPHGVLKSIRCPLYIPDPYA